MSKSRKSPWTDPPAAEAVASAEKACDAPATRAEHLGTVRITMPSGVADLVRHEARELVVELIACEGLEAMGQREPVSRLSPSRDERRLAADMIDSIREMRPDIEDPAAVLESHLGNLVGLLSLELADDAMASLLAGICSRAITVRRALAEEDEA